MKIGTTAFALVLAFGSPAFAVSDWIVRESQHPVQATVDKLIAAIEGAGAKVFATVDHAAGAKSIGHDMPPTVLVIFGNPKLGTPIIAADRRAGFDLPVRVLVWEDNDGTHIGYEAPDALKSRYDLPGTDEPLAAMTNALDKLTAAAAQ